MSESEDRAFSDADASFQTEPLHANQPDPAGDADGESAWQSLLIKVSTVFAVWLGY